VHLELALWKAACELSPRFRSRTRSSESVVLWREWKDPKARKRRDPLTSVTELVAPFLGLKWKGASKAV
jgi:hypothetical protein